VGESPYVSLNYRQTSSFKTLLTHLYVLIPVLDNEKHYWVGEDEIEKLLKRGEGWLSQHPEKELIVQRYLKRQAQLDARGPGTFDRGCSARRGSKGQRPRRRGTESRAPLNLNEQRMGAVLSLFVSWRQARS